MNIDSFKIVTPLVVINQRKTTPSSSSPSLSSFYVRFHASRVDGLFLMALFQASHFFVKPGCNLNFLNSSLITWVHLLRVVPHLVKRLAFCSMSKSPEANNTSNTTPEVPDALPFFILFKAFLSKSLSVRGCDPTLHKICLNTGFH